MKDPSEYSNLGDDLVLDEQERQTQLSDEQRLDIERRLEASQEMPTPQEQQAQQAVMAAKEAAQQEETSAPSTEGPYKDAEGNIDLEQIRKEGGELDMAAVTGLADFAADAVNFFLPDGVPQIPKATPYENKVAGIVRSISSVVFPTMAFQGAGMAMGRGAQAQAITKLGPTAKINQLGNTAFMKFVGSRGIEAGASVAVGAVSSEYEGDNLLGQIKQGFPETMDFIPDNWATLAGDSPDLKRQKSINEDLAMGFMIPMIGFAGKFASAVSEVKDVFKTAPKIVGESDQAVKYLAANRPKPTSEVPEEAMLEYQAKQDEALDELGYYNASKTDDPNIPLKGVHDLYDFRETGVRTVDDFWYRWC